MSSIANPGVLDDRLPADDPAGSVHGAERRQRILSSQRRDHRFFLTLGIVAALVVFFGYSQSYYLKPVQAMGVGRASPQLATLIHVHAALFTTYVLLYVLQTALVSQGRRALHMTLGWASVVLIPAMVVLGTIAVFWGAKLGHKQNWPDVETAALINVLDVYLFAVLAGAGILLRRRPEAHRRLMSFSFLVLLPAPLSRTGIIELGPAAMGIAVFGFLLVGPIYDLITRRRLHPAYAAGLLLAVVTAPPSRIAVAKTPAWHHLVSRMTR